MHVSCKVLGLHGQPRCSAVGSIVMGLQRAKCAPCGDLHGSAWAPRDTPASLCQTSVGIWALQLGGV